MGAQPQSKTGSDGDGENQAVDMFWVGEMGAFELKASGFMVAKEGFDPVAHLVDLVRGVVRRQGRDQANGFSVFFRIAPR